MHHRIRTTHQARRIRAGILAARHHRSQDLSHRLTWRAYIGTINHARPMWTEWIPA